MKSLRKSLTYFKRKTTFYLLCINNEPYASTLPCYTHTHARALTHTYKHNIAYINTCIAEMEHDHNQSVDLIATDF